MPVSVSQSVTSKIKTSKNIGNENIGNKNIENKNIGNKNSNSFFFPFEKKISMLNETQLFDVLMISIPANDGRINAK